MEILVLVLGITAAFIVGFNIKQKMEASRFASMGEIACSVCGLEGVDERGPGSYSCDHCHYDTDAVLSDEKALQVRQIQDLSIALCCLESANMEFEESRHRTRRVTRNGRTTTEHVGPFHARYLEGLEQAEEARKILDHQVRDQPKLTAGLDAIDAIRPPTDTKNGFNERVDEADIHLADAASAIRSARKIRVEAFRHPSA
jgi:hypothetical protein